MSTNHRSGFVALVGRPNVGKSTLLNNVLGQKIAIMSDKPQTTRNKIQGVYTQDDAQIVFIDTPGIHKPKHKLGTFMTNLAQKTFDEVDLILFLVDAETGYGKGDQFIIEQLKKTNTPVFLVVNKIDTVHPDNLLTAIDTYRGLFDFDEYVPISALKGNNVNTLLEQVTAYLKEGPQYYPEDQVTDHPERFIMAELIREKVLQLTEDEVPHSIAVVVEDIEYREDKDIVDVTAAIHVERSSQKGILIGKRGQMLKEIGSRARKDIEALLGTKVFLDLWVRVQKNWRNEEGRLKDFGFSDEDY